MRHGLSFFLYLSPVPVPVHAIHETLFYMAARMNERAANEERNEGSRVTDSRAPRLSTELPRCDLPVRGIRCAFRR